MNDESKPEKIPARDWWLAPLERIIARISRMLGWWYCSGCDEMHGPRTVKYAMRESRHVVPVCSIHRDPKLGKWDEVEADADRA